MIELLAPAGSYESLVAAVNAGADAVYMGGTKFGARAYAENPEEDRFIEGLKYAHRYGAKVYMTVNTLFKPREINELADYIKPYYLAGVDAGRAQRRPPRGGPRPHRAARTAAARSRAGSAAGGPPRTPRRGFPRDRGRAVPGRPAPQPG